MISGVDIVILVYKMLNVPALRTALGEGGLWQHNIPQNSPYTEVCIRIPTTDAYESELRFFDIDIRTPNLGTQEGENNFHPHPGLPQDNTFPDLVEFKRILDIILPLVETQGSLFVETKIPGVPMRDADGNWRVNIRVEFIILDDQDTHAIDLVELTGVSDGYGGYIPQEAVRWSGSARRIKILQNPQLDKTAGIYGLYLRCSWLLARNQVAPQKDMHIVTPTEEYIITGVTPNGIFWEVTTTRKDLPYG